MSEDPKSARNPLVIPLKETKATGCPKCGHPHFDGYAVQGVVTRKCRNKECKNVWSGGLPQVPQDPRVPHPPDPYQPALSFERKAPGTGQMRDLPTDVTEVRRPVDQRQEFRKGAPIPDGDE